MLFRSITWRSTIIKTLSNSHIVVPNSKLASAVITNYHMPEKELAISVDVGVSYQCDLSEVEKITIKVAREVMREVPGGVSEFEPFIRYSSFGDFGVRFSVSLRVQEFADQFLVKHEFIKKLHDRYRDAKIGIPASTDRLVRGEDRIG